MAQKVQTVIFSKERGDWTLKKAREWLKEHDFKDTKVDENDTQWRFRQFDPQACKTGSFKTLTKNLPEGVEMVSCDVAEKLSAVAVDAFFDTQTSAAGPMVIARRSVKDVFVEANRPQPQSVGRDLAEKLGRPDLAEKPFVHMEQIGEVSESSGLEFDVVISSDRPNRSGDIVHQDGWDFEAYDRYPIVLLGHADCSPAADIIGKNLSHGFEKQDGHTVMVGRDRLMDTEDGQRLAKVARFIGNIGASVGFIPRRIGMRVESDEEKGDQIVGIDYFENEKVEHSFVVIPANADGAARLISQGLINQRLLGMLQLSQASPPPPKDSDDAATSERLDAILQEHRLWLLRQTLCGKKAQRGES